LWHVEAPTFSRQSAHKWRWAAVRMSALRAGRPLHPRKIPGTHFCWVDPRAMVRLERLGKLKKCTSSGTRTGDLPACSIMPQPTTLPLAPV
jgi:hypothetical protein